METQIKSIIAVLLILVGTTSLGAELKSTVPFYMYNAASVFKIDIALMYAICKVESNCRSGAVNKNDSNSTQRKRGQRDRSYGLFQIKKATAKSLGFDSRSEDLLNPETNSWYAAKLLRHLFDKYKDTKKVVSAYNAGKYTKMNAKYVGKVLNNYANYKMSKRF